MAAPGAAGAGLDGMGPAPLAALRTDVLGSPTASGAAGQRTPGSSAKSRQLVYLGQLYGAEVVGRKCAVLHNRHGKQGFEKAHIIAFDPDTGQHQLRHHVDRVEEWLSLADIKFKWTQLAAPDAPPNPMFKPEYSGEAAVGKRLRVYWPAMQKWYCGTVRAYDPLTGMHTVFYKDGDQQALMLKQEPVIWADDELAMQADGVNLITWVAANTPNPNASGADPWATAVAAAATLRPPGVGGVGGSSTAAAAAGAGGAGAMAPGLSGVPAGGGAVGGMIPIAATGAAAVGAGGAPAALLGSSSHAVGPGQAAAAAGGMPRPPGSAGLSNPQGRSPATAAAAAAAMHVAVLRTVFPPTPPGSRGGGRGGRGGRGGMGGRGVLGKHGRADGGSHDGSAAGVKKRRGPASQKLRQTAMAAAAAVAIPNKHLAVNCRVGVYWRLDKAFYTGKLKAYSPQTGKFTLQYDDGQCESLLLERERFIWHAPRGSTAGYKPALHVLMQQLGTEGLKGLLTQQEGPDGKVVPLTPRPEAAPHPPSTGQGAVGWRVQLYWPADGAWHEGEVLCYNETKRLHHVLYLDGEEEWLDLSNEMVVWTRATRSGGALSTGHFLSSDDVPKGRDALGWHLSVYWKDDKQFYHGQVAEHEPNTGRHKVLYQDGEEEWLHLRNERVIWRMPRSEVDDSGEVDDAMLLDDAALDSDDSIDIMEACEEVTDDMTTDDDGIAPPTTTTAAAGAAGGAGAGATGAGAGGGTGVGARKKGGGATQYRRLKKRLRTRKSRLSRLGFDSDHSSEPGRHLHRQQQQWGSSTAVGLQHAGGGGSYTHADAAGAQQQQQHHLLGSPAEQAAAGSAFGHYSAARPPLAGVPGAADAGALPAATGAAGKGLIGRQPSAPPGGSNGLFGHYGQQQQQQGAAGGSMRAPLAPGSAAAGGGIGGAGGGGGTAAVAMGAAGGVGGGAAAGGQLARTSTTGGLARATSSGLLAAVNSSALLSLNLPAINIRRAGGTSIDGTGSPLIRQSLDTLQLSVKIIPGGTATSSAALTSGAAAAASAGVAVAGVGVGGVGGVAPVPGAAGGATAAALQPVLQHLPPGRRRAAVQLQRKMDRLDMISAKLTSMANMYGWRLEPQEPLPPLLTSPQRAGGGRGVGRPRSQPTSPTGVRLGLGSPRNSSGPLSPRAIAAAAARAAAAGMGSNAGSLPTSPRNGLGPLSPTAAAAAAAGGGGGGGVPAAAGRTVAVHKTCAVKSRAAVGGGPTSSNGSGAQRRQSWSYGLAAPNPPSSSSTGQHAGIGAGTAGGSGELTSLLAAAATAGAASTGQQQQEQQQQAPAAGAAATAAESAAKQQQQQQQQQQAVAAAAALQQASAALTLPGLSAASLAALAAPAGTAGAGGAGAAASVEATLAASAARAAVEAVLTSGLPAGINPMSLLQAAAAGNNAGGGGTPAATAAAAAASAAAPDASGPSVSRAADEVVCRLQALAQLNTPNVLQQQLQSWQSAAAAAAAANAAAAAAASAAVSESGGSAAAAAATRPVAAGAAAGASAAAAGSGDAPKSADASAPVAAAAPAKVKAGAPSQAAAAVAAAPKAAEGGSAATKAAKPAAAAVKPAGGDGAATHKQPVSRPDGGRSTTKAAAAAAGDAGKGAAAAAAPTPKSNLTKAAAALAAVAAPSKGGEGAKTATTRASSKADGKK